MLSYFAGKIIQQEVRQATTNLFWINILNSEKDKDITFSLDRPHTMCRSFSHCVPCNDDSTQYGEGEQRKYHIENTSEHWLFLWSALNLKVQAEVSGKDMVIGTSWKSNQRVQSTSHSMNWTVINLNCKIIIEWHFLGRKNVHRKICKVSLYNFWF